MDLFYLQQNFTLILETFAIIFLVLFVLTFFFKSNKTTTTNFPPEASGSWPIIGHFKVFNGSDLPHVTLSSMADQYGPIFMVRLGIRRVLVVSDWEIAKDIFTTHDVNVSDRPDYIAAKILGFNGASFAFTPYGPYWVGIRKIISQKLLSNSRLEKLKLVREIELESAIKNMHDLWREKRDGQGKVLVEMKKWFGELNMNTMLKVVAGKRYVGDDDDDEEMMSCREVIRNWFEYLGQFVVADALPFLGWMDLGGYEKTMKRVAKQLDSMVGKWLEEHHRKRSSGNAGEVNDFMDVMIQVVKDDDVSGYNADTIIKATCESLIGGGADTTTVMLTWTLSLLLNNRYALKKAQEEIDTQVGKDHRRVNESDIKNLVYLQAVVKETLRLYPATFLGAPRAFTKDCTIAGYHVPKGTWLLTNPWKLHRDPKIWPDPCEFRPERFLTSDHKELNVKWINFEMIPFGAGRRRCPGITFANQMLHMVLATLIQNFEMVTPNDAPIDMSAIAGLTNAKASPLEVLVSPR